MSSMYNGVVCGRETDQFFFNSFFFHQKSNLPFHVTAHLTTQFNFDSYFDMYRFINTLASPDNKTFYR